MLSTDVPFGWRRFREPGCPIHARGVYRFRPGPEEDVDGRGEDECHWLEPTDFRNVEVACLKSNVEHMDRLWYDSRPVYSAWQHT